MKKGVPCPFFSLKRFFCGFDILTEKKKKKKKNENPERSYQYAFIVTSWGSLDQEVTILWITKKLLGKHPVIRMSQI